MLKSIKVASWQEAVREEGETQHKPYEVHVPTLSHTVTVPKTRIVLQFCLSSGSIKQTRYNDYKALEVSDNVFWARPTVYPCFHSI